jgi:hypothetical protein
LPEDRRCIDRVADQWREQRPGAGLLDRIELAVLQILDPGREPVAQQVAEAEHVIRRTGGVCVVLDDAQIGLVGVMVQTVEHVRRFAHRRRNDPRVEWSVMAGHMRVEHRAGIDAVFGIDGPARTRATSGPEILSVRRRGYVPSSPVAASDACGRVDDGGAGGDVGCRRRCATAPR